MTARGEAGSAVDRAPLERVKCELRRAFAAAGLATLFANVGLLFVPVYDMILFDRVLLSKNMDTVTILSICCAAGMGLFALLEFLRSMIFIVASDRITRSLGVPAFAASLRKSLGGEPSAVGQALRDLNELRLFATGSAATAPLDLVWTPALLAVLWLLHPAYGVYGLVCAGTLFVISLATDLSTRDDLKAATVESAACLSELSSALRNVETVEGMGMLPAVARRWRRRHGAALDSVGRAARRAKLFGSLAKTARLAMQAGVIFLGVVLVMNYQASPGSMMGSNLLVARLLLPFELLVSGWRQWTSAAAAWVRVRGLLHGATKAPAQADRDEDASEVAAQLALFVDAVSFTPPEALRPVLMDVSFSVAPGEAVAICGPSGAGKSSLARLIVGILRPDVGRILVDGRPVGCWDRAALGRRVGYLPQSLGLLDGSVLDNISRFREEGLGPAVEAARLAGVHDLVGRLPHGYGTWIGEAGYALSGGQRQRVALARALLGAPALLVLDEPNANLDHEGDASLAAAVREAKAGGAAVVLVTHRPAAVAACDRVLTMQRGRIVSVLPAAEWARAQGRIDGRRTPPDRIEAAAGLGGHSPMESLR